MSMPTFWPLTPDPQNLPVGYHTTTQTSSTPSPSPSSGAKWDQRFLELAALIASWSKDPSTQTGAVIVGPNRGVVSVGFNGFPQGMPDDEALYADRDEKLSRIVHCEVNAVLLAGRPIPPGSTLYTWPFMSCDRCMVVMLQAGLRRFVAPAAPADKAERWADIMNKAKRYIHECGGELIEV